MSNYAPPPEKPDSRIFASYPMPAKIDLIRETPRRESLIEKQLEDKIGSSILPRIEVSPGSPIETSGNGMDHRHQETITISRGQLVNADPSQSVQQHTMVQEQVYHDQGGTRNQSSAQASSLNDQPVTGQTTIMQTIINNKASLAGELAEKEAKLVADINSLNQRPYSPYQVPPKIDLVQEQLKSQRQVMEAASSSSRPMSRVSNRSAADDLLDKEAQLLQEIEEMERKPFNPQRMVVEREQWYEYPEDNPQNRHITESKRRVKDFCSLPSHMYGNQATHIHEENLPSGRPLSSAGSIHTTILRSPKREIDNKSPLPFAFDNFTTKGVRGNIASVGAVEPDRPRPPIYPIIKRSPSPNIAHI